MKLGDIDIAAIYYGSRPIVAAYIGDIQVWPINSALMHGVLSAQSDGAANLGVRFNVASQLIAATALGGSLARERGIAGALIGASALTAPLARLRQIDGLMAAASGSAADLSITHDVLIAAILAAQSDMTAIARVTRAVATVMAAASGSASPLGIIRGMASTLSAVSALVTAPFIIGRGLIGASNAVSAMSASMTVLSGSIVGTFLQTAVDTANLTTYTFAAQNLGTAAADRKILTVVALGDGRRSISTVTVDGVSATELGEINSTDITGSGTHLAFYISDNPSNTSGDVVVTASAGCDNCAIAMFHITGLPSSTPLATNSAQNADPISISGLSANTSGYCIAAAIIGGGTTVNWSALAGLSEVADITIETTQATLSIAAGVPNANPITLTADFAAGTASLACMFAATW